MIETIRKKINIDKSKSHTPGILPYILCDDGRKYKVSMGDGNGNWGNFPMDIAIAKKEIVTGELFGLTYCKFRYKNGEEGSYHSDDTNRFKYATIAMMYNEIQKILDESSYTKAVRKYKNADGPIYCEERDCAYNIPERETEYDIVLSKKFGKVNEIKSNILTECNGETIYSPGRYDFIPVPQYYFTYNEDGTCVNKYSKNFDENFTLEEGKYYVIMPDYDTYRKYENLWAEWWQNNGISPNQYFPIESGDFLFCRTVEKYIIGKAEVPQDIEGLRVPNYVYYTEVESYKDWFEKNGLTTVEGVNNAPKDLVKKFKEMGGFEFYNFLTNLSTEIEWITSIPSVDGGYGMTYVTPYISLSVSLEDNHEYGGIYENYLYSYVEKGVGCEYDDSGLHNSEQNLLGYTYGIGNQGDDCDFGDNFNEDYYLCLGNSGICDFNTDFNDDFYICGVCDFSNDFNSDFDICNGGDVNPGGDGDEENEKYVCEFIVKGDFVPAYSQFTGYNKTFDRWYVPDDLYCESMLCYVIDDEAREVEGVTGTWSAFTDGGQMFRCTYFNGSWNFEETNEDIPCGDGEVPAADGKYRSITTIGVVEYAVPNPSNGVYYFLVKKNNDANHPFEVPYTDGSFHDMRETDEENVFIGNYITSISIEDGRWTIQYVIGGLAFSDDGGLTFNAINKTGVKYEETYPYHEGGILKTFMDGYEGIRVYYNWIDIDTAKESVYSDEYRIYRKANRAKVVGMEVGGMLTDDNMINAMIFTRSGSDSLPDYTKNEFNVSINRGNAAAFERYFKLSECNSFEDLQHYGNNFYNL